VQVAGALGLPTRDAHWRRLEAKPEDPQRWFQAMPRSGDEAGIAALIDLFEGHFNLSEIATGAAEEWGRGPGWTPHLCLSYLLQALENFPGKGIPLILTGLQSPLLRNRSMATAALGGWGIEACGAELRQALEAAFSVEPNESTRMRMRRVLDGLPYDG